MNISGADNINHISQISNLAFISSRLPSNVQTFLLSTSTGSIKRILPDWGKIDESDYVCHLDGKFRKAEFDCLTYNNIRHVIFIVFLILIVKSFFATTTTILIFFEKKDTY